MFGLVLGLISSCLDWSLLDQVGLVLGWMGPLLDLSLVRSVIGLIKLDWSLVGCCPWIDNRSDLGWIRLDWSLVVCDLV